MDKYIIKGGVPLRGEVTVSGAKNVAMKVLLAGLLTDDKVIIRGVPHISSVAGTADIIRHLGVTVEFTDHTLNIDASKLKYTKVPLDIGSKYRTATMVIGPLLSRIGRAQVPNPGGCRLGQRPIDMHITGLHKMGVTIKYNSHDGYFYATAPKKLRGISFRFYKNTHTGTETLILASVLAEGKTVLENAAEEPEIDDLINLLNQMGASIKREKNRKIIINGVDKLHGTEYKIMPDRNEAVTYAVAAIATGGDVIVHGAQPKYIKAFLYKLNQVGVGYDKLSNDSIRFYFKQSLKSLDIVTSPHPGFMTDWQGPWTVLMTQAQGVSTVHETIFEGRFSYVSELKKMGADITFYKPEVKDPQDFYNFNYQKNSNGTYQAIKIKGPVSLHDAILNSSDIRAGATLVIAALTASGESHISGINHIERGYEDIDKRLQKLGASMKRVKEEE